MGRLKVLHTSLMSCQLEGMCGLRRGLHVVQREGVGRCEEPEIHDGCHWQLRHTDVKYQSRVMNGGPWPKVSERPFNLQGLPKASGNLAAETTEACERSARGLRDTWTGRVRADWVPGGSPAAGVCRHEMP
jgi:hypothetical protein